MALWTVGTFLQLGGGNEDAHVPMLFLAVTLHDPIRCRQTATIRMSRMKVWGLYTLLLQDRCCCPSGSKSPVMPVTPLTAIFAGPNASLWHSLEKNYRPIGLRRFLTGHRPPLFRPERVADRSRGGPSRSTTSERSVGGPSVRTTHRLQAPAPGGGVVAKSSGRGPSSGLLGMGIGWVSILGVDAVKQEDDLVRKLMRKTW